MKYLKESDIFFGSFGVGVFLMAIVMLLRGC